MRRTHPATAAVALMLLVWAPAAAGQEAPVRPTALHDYRLVPVAEGLQHPWSIAFLPGGDMLVTEQPGRLRIVRDGRLLEDPVPGVPEVHAEGQGGLLEVRPHPDFDSNRYLYLSYSKPLQGGEESTTAVVRGRFENDRLTNVEEIFEARSRGRGHYGCRLAFDDEGHLFLTVGDRQASTDGDLEDHLEHPAQDLSNHHGVVIRLHDDGTVPEDNPFVDDAEALDEIWSYGHRNAQGLVIHRETGDLWITEHGPQGGDELNLVEPGLNYGWPVVGYGVNYGSGTAIHMGTRREGMEHPEHVWVPSIGTSGLMIYDGERFPEWRGSIFAGGLSGQQLARLVIDGREVVVEETVVHDVGRIRDVRQGPDGYIYVAIDDEESPVLRMEPAQRH